MLNHLLGRSLPSEQTGHDSVFLTSTGRLTSYSPDGEPNWQVIFDSYILSRFLQYYIAAEIFQYLILQ